VDNGLKGDKAAWLLVLAKFPSSGGAVDGLARKPDTPNDAVLLGPYITMKNTFLDESRVDAQRYPQPPRAKSWGACRP